MLDKLCDNPDMQKHRRAYEKGQMLTLEGEEAQDLFILISGEVEVLKGDKVIALMHDKGDVFGEMSFLLGGVRTASLRAGARTEVLKVPADQVQGLLDTHPGLLQELARLLARRLDMASQITAGLRELSDQVPEAVVILDREERLLSANRAARELMGGNWAAMRGATPEEMLSDPEVWQGYVREVQSGGEVKEAPLEIAHPRKGPRTLSVSMNQLYDARHTPQGLVVTARDITHAQQMRRRFRLTVLWALPLLLILGGYAAYSAWWTTQLTGHMRTLGEEKASLRNQMARDFFMAEPLLLEAFPHGKTRTHPLLERFAKVQSDGESPYTGLILVGPDNRVFDAMGVKDGLDLQHLVGTSYGRLMLTSGEEKLHRVLQVNRQDPKKGINRSSVEVAFELTRLGRLLGWVVFQMDMDRLEKEGVTVDDLKDIQFARPG